MKKVLALLIVATILLPTSLAIGIPPSDKAKTPNLEKIVFIHWKKDFTKPPCDNDGICDPEENPSCADCKKEEETAPSCYDFLGKYGKKYLQWRELPVNYTINPANPQGLEESFVAEAVFKAAEEWDFWTSAELMNDAYTIDYTVTYGTQDYVNAIAFGDYPSEGVIAVTTVWYNPATKTIVEFDVMFDTDWVWGDATVDSSVMDLQNIATHEFGHGIGLDDVYEAECSAVTMYGYSDYGETQKRTLEQPDITGLQTLYGA